MTTAEKIIPPTETIPAPTEAEALRAIEETREVLEAIPCLKVGRNGSLVYRRFPKGGQPLAVAGTIGELAAKLSALIQDDPSLASATWYGWDNGYLIVNVKGVECEIRNLQKKVRS